MPIGSATRGRLYILTAALLWSMGGLFVKSGALQQLAGPTLAGYRALFAAVCLWPFVRMSMIRWRWQLVPMSGSFAAMNVLFLTAMTMTSAAATVFLQYTSTVWAFLFAVLIWRERVDHANLIALIGAVIGIAWIVAGDRSTNLTGNALAIGSGVTYAGVILCLRTLRSEQSAWLIALNQTVSAAVLLPWLMMADVPDSITQWAALACLGGLQMALPYVLFARGLHSVGAQEAGLIALLEPIMNPVWVWLAWGEEVSPSTYVGGAVIVIALAIRYSIRPMSSRATSEDRG